MARERILRPLVGALCAAGATTILTRSLSTVPALSRLNHSGDSVSLSEGVSLATTLTVAALARHDYSAAAALSLATGAGLIDDWDASSRPLTRLDVHTPLIGEDAPGASDPPPTQPPAPIPIKGLRGHLGALRKGKLSSGVTKIVLLSAAAALHSASLRLPLRCGAGKRSLAGPLFDIGLDTVIVAGGANLANLFDLRPGRALKACAASGTIHYLATSFTIRNQGGNNVAAATLAGTIIASAPTDLGADTMLGDTGANPLGMQTAMLATALPRAWRISLAVATVALTLASERVSFSRVIDSHPLLNRIDRWGRAETGKDPAGDPALASPTAPARVSKSSGR